MLCRGTLFGVLFKPKLTTIRGLLPQATLRHCIKLQEAHVNAVTKYKTFHPSICLPAGQLSFQLSNPEGKLHVLGDI